MLKHVGFKPICLFVHHNSHVLKTIFQCCPQSEFCFVVFFFLLIIYLHIFPIFIDLNLEIFLFSQNMRVLIFFILLLTGPGFCQFGGFNNIGGLFNEFGTGGLNGAIGTNDICASICQSASNIGNGNDFDQQQAIRQFAILPEQQRQERCSAVYSIKTV